MHTQLSEILYCTYNMRIYIGVSPGSSLLGTFCRRGIHALTTEIPSYSSVILYHLILPSYPYFIKNSMLFCSRGDFAGVYRHHNHSPVTQSFSEAIQPILNSVKFYTVGIT